MKFSMGNFEAEWKGDAVSVRWTDGGKILNFSVPLPEGTKETAKDTVEGLIEFLRKIKGDLEGR